MQVHVFGNGERLVLNKQGVYKGKDIAITQQYYLVGAFDGEDTKRAYWVYGSNDANQSKMSASERVGSHQTSSQTSNN